MVHVREMGVETGEAKVDPEANRAIMVGTPPHLDLARIYFNPCSVWLYVASMAGIVERGMHGGEKWWWAEAVWA
jgi:hypothetical protein